MHRVAQISALSIYPVKGCAGIALEEATIDALGLAGDRRFLMVDSTGRMLTQRSHPQLARVGTALSDTTLTLSFDRAPPLHVPRTEPGAPLREVSVWSASRLQAEDCGDEAAAWVSAVVGAPTRLTRAGRAFHRPVKPGASRPEDLVGFADAYPLLAIGGASLEALNDRLFAAGATPLPMNRFRPNLVFAGSGAFAEDGWSRFQVGGVVFRVAGPCARCTVTTTDQLTGLRDGPEPLRTLARFRRDPRDPAEVVFGQNVIHETKSGRVHVGDDVHLLDDELA